MAIGEVLSYVWSVISSPIAVGIYVILVLAAVIALIAFMLAEERNRPDPELIRGYIDRINEIIRSFEARGEKNVVLDAPTLIESGFSRECNTVVSVLAPRAERIERIMTRDNISEEAALMRVNAQKSDEFYIENSSCVIMNDSGADELYKSFDKLFAQIVTGGTDE